MKLWMAIGAGAVAVVGYGGYRIARHYGQLRRDAMSSAGSPVCSGRTKRRVPEHTVIAFGDSLTWGAYASRGCVTQVETIDPRAHLVGPKDTTYPGDLSRMMDYPVLNYGVPGETAQRGLHRLREIVAVVHPSVVIVLEGINDLRAGASPATVASRVRALQRAARGRAIVLTLLPTDIDGLGAGVRRTDALLPGAVNVYQTLAGRAGLYAVDGLHLNDAGYRRLAAAVARALRAR